MRIGALRLRRAALAAWGGAAAAALAGCQTPGSQFVSTGVARGDAIPASPAFARVAAGQQMARGGMSGRTTAPVASESVMMTQPMPVIVPQSAAASSPIMGSGGMIYPLNYAPPAAPAMMPPTMTVPTAPMMTVTQQPMIMPAQQQMMPTAAAPASPVGQQTLLLVNGPNGPQYVVAEVIGQVQTQPTAPVMTMPMAHVPVAPPAPPTLPAPPTPPAPPMVM